MENTAWREIGSVSAFMEIRGFLSYKRGKRNSRIGVLLVFGLWSEGKCIVYCN
jgi:hypothetical protein